MLAAMTRHGVRRPRADGPQPRLRSRLLLLPSLLLAGLLAGCGSAPGTVDPSGVDGLLVPSPTPDPDDFSATVDNPWLPLAPGSQRVYEVTADGATTTRTDTVATGVRSVAGVPTTAVRSVVTDERGAVVDETLAWFAQDDDGNVWALGVEQQWEAGKGGAGAVLAMPAAPRLGDGYVHGYEQGAEVVARVGEPGSSVSVPAGRFTELLQVREHPADDADTETQVYYARGVGEVVRIGPGGESRSELVELTQP